METKTSQQQSVKALLYFAVITALDLKEEEKCEDGLSKYNNNAGILGVILNKKSIFALVVAASGVAAEDDGVKRRRSEFETWVPLIVSGCGDVELTLSLRSLISFSILLIRSLKIFKYSSD
ncbi:20585_t:CDS:2 [Entrophospora sp. SA101]|nr:20585_t:CDS:2 [Entrophospora sp. SA101]